MTKNPIKSSTQPFHPDNPTFQDQLTELKDKTVSVEPFKESILKFKLNHKVMAEKELKDWLKDNVERIILDQDIIKMDVKKLPFRLE